MSTDRARQAAGQPTGGQFAATAGTDAGLDLAAEESNGTSVSVDSQRPEAQRLADALGGVPNLGDVYIVVADQDRFAATATIYGEDYRISQYDNETTRVVLAGGSPYGDALLSEENVASGMERALVQVREHHIADKSVKEVQAILHQEGESQWRYPVAMRRRRPSGLSSAMTEIGYALPGDHVKVRVFSDDTTQDGSRSTGNLYARSSTRDAPLDNLTERQNKNRLNKVLDSIGPNRVEAEEVLRNTLVHARSQHDVNMANDMLLKTRSK